MINNSKNKRLKKLINSKILYTLPLAGIGIIGTQQTANAMFNPPRNTPTVKHFNGASSSSLSRPLTSTTSPRPSTSTSPYKPTGSKVSSLVSRFETSSNSLQQNLPSGTGSTQNLSTKAEIKPTPNYSSLGARPKTNTSSSSLYSKNTSHNPEDESLIDASLEFKESIKNTNSEVLSTRLHYELSYKLDNTTSKFLPNEEETRLQKVIAKISKYAFITETKKELSRRNIMLNEENEKNLNDRAFYFSNYIGNLSASKFNEKLSIFNTMNINKDSLPYIKDKIKVTSYDFGNDTGSIAAYELILAVNRFIKSHQ